MYVLSASVLLYLYAFNRYVSSNTTSQEGVGTTFKSATSAPALGLVRAATSVSSDREVAAALTHVDAYTGGSGDEDDESDEGAA